jgi:hypothetical protein
MVATHPFINHVNVFYHSPVQWHRGQRKETSNTEITLVNQKILFSSLSARGITNKRKIAAWENVTDAVHSVGSEVRTLSEVKKMV